MFRKSTGAEPSGATWLGFAVREITGSWVSTGGAPSLRIYRDRSRKNGGLYAKLTYNNPPASFAAPLRNSYGVRYFDLFGRVGLAYDAERDVLLLSAYGEYVRAE